MRNYLKKWLAMLTVFCMCINFSGNINVVYAEPMLKQDDDVIAYAVLGEEVQSKGMKVWMGNVNEPILGNKEGKDAWILDTSNGKNSVYLYVDLDDNIMSNLTDGSNIEVEIEYYDDTNKGSLTFEYPEYNFYNVRLKPVQWATEDVGEKAPTELEHFDFGGSNCWMTKKWLVQNPALNNSLEGGDFRIGVYSDTLGTSENEKTLIHSVKVRKTGTKDQIGISFEKESTYSLNYYTGEDITVDVAFNNNKNAIQSRNNGTYSIDVTYTLLDSEYGTEVAVQKESFELKPCSKNVRKAVFDTDNLDYNVYTLRVEAENRDLKLYSRYEQKVAYIYSTHGEIINEKAGINITTFPAGKAGDDLIRLLKNTGFRHVRNPMTGTNNQLTVSAYGDDKTRVSEHALPGYMTSFLGKLAENGMTLQGMHGSQHRNLYSDYRYETNPPADISYIPYTKEGMQRFANTSLELMRLEGSYGSDAFAYEIGNEWDLARPRDAVKNATDTGKLYKYVYPILKEQYPHVMIGGPVTSGVTSNVSWLKNFMSTAEGNFDMITVHPYTNHGHPIQFDVLRIKGTPEDCHILDIRELMDEMGYEDKEMWATEWGNIAYTRECYGHRQQAAWNSIIYMQMMENDVIDRWYHFQIADGVLDRSYGERNFGVVDYLGTGKPQLLALSHLNALTYDAKFVSRTNLNNKQTVAYRYRKEKSQTDLMALMTSVESETLSVDLGTNSVTMYDMYGNKIELISPDGTYTFAFNEEPIYVEGNFTKYEFIDRASVGITNSLRVAGHSSSVIVDAHNNSDEELTIEAKPLTLNDTNVISKIEPRGEEGEIRLSVDKTPIRGSEPVYVEIKGEEGIYFAGRIFISHQSAADISTIACCDENMNWFVDATIINLLDEKQTGTVQITYPEEWKYKIDNVAIEANDTRVISIPLPDGAGESGIRSITLAYTVDDEGSGTYVTNLIEFAFAPKASSPITVDGKLDEWTKGWIYMNSGEQFAEMTGFANTFYGVTDLWAKVAVQWDNENFYFAAEVHDDTFINNVLPSQMWSQDNIQLGIIYDPDNEYSTGQFEELSFSLNNGKPAIYRHSTVSQGLEDNSKLSDYDLEIVQEGDALYYELRVSWKDLMPNTRAAEKNKIIEGTAMRFGCIINESDGGDRKGFYFIGDDGIGNTKNSSKFTQMYMAGEIKK